MYSSRSDGSCIGDKRPVNDERRIEDDLKYQYITDKQSSAAHFPIIFRDAFIKFYEEPLILLVSRVRVTFYCLLTSREAQGVYYTVVKHDRHLRTRRKCRKHEPRASVFYISRVFSNAL